MSKEKRGTPRRCWRSLPSLFSPCPPAKPHQSRAIIHPLTPLPYLATTVSPPATIANRDRKPSIANQRSWPLARLRLQPWDPGYERRNNQDGAEPAPTRTRRAWIRQYHRATPKIASIEDTDGERSKEVPLAKLNQRDKRWDCLCRSWKQRRRDWSWFGTSLWTCLTGKERLISAGPTRVKSKRTVEVMLSNYQSKHFSYRTEEQATG